jgi:hypothetical protein
LIASTVEWLRRDRWLLHAVTLHARRHPELVSRGQREGRQRLLREARESLLAFRHEVTHPDPEVAVGFGLFVALTACREAVVFAATPLAASTALDDSQLVDEVTKGLVAYLTSGSASGRLQTDKD